MTEEEIRERVREILLKQSLGEALTSQEETILAYAHYAAGEQAVRMWVQPDIEAAEQQSQEKAGPLADPPP